MNKNKEMPLFNVFPVASIGFFVYFLYLILTSTGDTWSKLIWQIPLALFCSFCLGILSVFAVLFIFIITALIIIFLLTIILRIAETKNNVQMMLYVRNSVDIIVQVGNWLVKGGKRPF